MHEIHDWGAHMDKFLEDFEARGGWSQFDNGNQPARGNPEEASLGHENRLAHEYGPATMVPGYEKYPSMDPGLFWNGRDF